MSNGPAATETRHLLTIFSLGAVGGLTDGQLLERFATLDGDPAELAFAALVDRHGPMVLRVARSALVDGHSAHDAFQATFLILAKKARSLWVRDSLGPWLHAVAYRVASQSRASEARHKRCEKEAARPEAYQPREWAQTDLARVIHQEIERLPQPYRIAVVTCHLEGLTQHEAAARLGWPVGTLQSRLARGRQRLRDRLRRRGLAPSLGVLASRLAPVPQALTTATAKLASTLHLGGTVAGMIPPAVLAMIETTTKGMLMTKLKFGVLMLACGLVASGMGLGVGRTVRATDGEQKNEKVETPRTVEPGTNKLTSPGDGKAESGPSPSERVLAVEPGGSSPVQEEEPEFTILSNPKPWETVVRIKLHHSDSEWGFGSGTVISSTAEESIVLTQAHQFRIEYRPQPGPKEFRVPITVDLFGSQFVRRQPAQLECTQKDIPGEVIDYDFTNDVGLIRIRPFRKLPYSRVVPTSWHPQKGMSMMTVGCSHGEDATAWNTTILDPHVTMSNTSTKENFATIKCAHQPKEGRSGGGLYTTDGYVAGVCNFADPNEHVGLYAVPEAIYRLLDRNGLSSIYGSKATDGLRPAAVEPVKVPTIARDLPRVEDVDIHGSKSPAPSSLLDAAGRAPSRPAAREPVRSPAVSDQDRRLDDLERKLDQVLKALEALKGDNTPARRMGILER